jgi:3D (Asp-Asp-Asp) domain-containing protein
MNHDKIDRILNIAVLIGIVVLLVSPKISFDLQGKLHRQIEVLEAEKYIWKQIAEANISQASSLAPKYAVLTVTAFTNRPQETNNCPRTATMEQAVPGWTVAVSRDLIHWLGGRVYIEGVGVRRVNDLMNARHEQTLDLLVGTVGDAVEWGRQERMVVYLGL